MKHLTKYLYRLIHYHFSAFCLLSTGLLFLLTYQASKAQDQYQFHLKNADTLTSHNISSTRQLITCQSSRLNELAVFTIKQFRSIELQLSPLPHTQNSPQHVAVVTVGATHTISNFKVKQWNRTIDTSAPLNNNDEENDPNDIDH